jgi:hypothetical protein
MNCGFCVSTVSTVSIGSGCGRGSMALVAGCTGRRLARPIIVADATDGADGADGIFRPHTNPDHPISRLAFTAEGDLDTQRA